MTWSSIFLTCCEGRRDNEEQSASLLFLSPPLPPLHMSVFSPKPVRPSRRVPPASPRLLQTDRALHNVFSFPLPTPHFYFFSATSPHSSSLNVLTKLFILIVFLSYIYFFLPPPVIVYFVSLFPFLLSFLSLISFVLSMLLLSSLLLYSSLVCVIFFYYVFWLIVIHRRNTYWKKNNK